MDRQRQAARKVLEDIENSFRDDLEKAIQNATCFQPGCPATPIGSHIISKKHLRRIAENNRVLTWRSPDDSLIDIADAVDAGRPIDQPNMIPEPVSIDFVKLTDPLFCHTHDERIFLQIEKREIAAHAERIPKQVLLLAYRALCSLTFQFTHLSPIEILLEAAKKAGYKHSLHEPERLARLYRFLAKDIMFSVYQRHEQIRRSGDYSQLGYALYVMDVPPCIAATYSLIPIEDDEAKAITDGTLRLNPEDAISFTFLPHAPLTNSVCIISWLKDSQRARSFMILNRINELSDEERRDLLFHFAFESPTVYMSPQWWHSLSGEKRVEYTLTHFNTAREHAELI